MLTGLRLGNFKAFGETQHIPIKPLTLIFGANSAGKSSIIHGLLLACHAAETGNLNTYQTRLGGETVDLGGFRQYVHRRDTSQNVQIETQYRKSLVDSFDDTFGPETHRAEALVNVQFTISIDFERYATAKPVTSNVRLHINNEQLFQLTRNAHNCFEFNHINYTSRHFNALLQSYAYSRPDLYINMDLKDKKLVEDCFRIFLNGPGIKEGTFILNGLSQDEIDGDWTAAESPSNSYNSEFAALLKDAKFSDTYIGLTDGLFELIQELVRGLLFEYKQVRYLGPLRSYPSRHLAFPDEQDPHWYAGGGYAWEAVRTNPKVRKHINRWLGSEKWLRTPYELTVRRYILEGSANDAIEELVLRDKRFNTFVSHRDIGIGISQVLPVLVSAYASEQQTIAIEQPEIHLHPALQGELGDVFIESALGERKNTFLLETHSEHLILRIMRRMRDTVRGTLPEGMPPVRPEDVAVLYVDRKDDDSTSVVTELALDEEGQLLDPWPGGFFEEGYNERFA